MILEKELRVKLNMDDFTTKELTDELEERGEGLIMKFEKDELIKELKRRHFDFSKECEEDHYSKEEQETFQAISSSNPSVRSDIDDNIMARFVECHALLKWEQWNHIFSRIEKMSRAERDQQPVKYDKL